MKIFPANSYQTNNNKQINFGLWQVKAAEPISHEAEVALSQKGYVCLSNTSQMISHFLESSFNVTLSNYFKKGVVEIVATKKEADDIFNHLQVADRDHFNSGKLLGHPSVPWKASIPLRWAKTTTVDELLKKPTVSK